ncbi:hypothetical protein [Ferruginibacter profundus]
MENIINNEFPEYTSPFGEGSIFNDEGYVNHVNFEKLIPDIKMYHGTMIPYDYRIYESKVTVPAGDPFPGNFFPPHTESKDEGDTMVDQVLDELRSVLIPPGIPSDTEYKQGKDLLFFDGVLNKKRGYIKIDRNHIGFVFELDPGKGIIKFRDHIYYTDPVTQKRKNQWAIQIETMNFETYRALCKAEGLYLSASSLDNIQRRYTDALNKAKDKPGTMAWLYHWMPDFVFKTRDNDSLINDLATILQGSVREHGYKYINEEALVLKIIGAFATGKKDDHDCLLGEFSTRLINKKVMFQILYEKMNDWAGQPNFTAAMRVLYLIWSYSSYANPNNHTYNGQPETLAYQPKKILGFYTDNYSFKFDKQSIMAYEKVTVHYRTGNRENPDDFREELQFRAAYSFFQPVQLPEIGEEGEMILPDTLIPAFYLKAFADKNVWHDFEKATWLVLDIVTTFSGFGNLLKLRYLATLPKWARILRLSFGVVELASGVMSTMLNFVNSCDEKGSFCSKLKNYLNWLNLCAGAADIAFTLVEKKLWQTGGEALEELGKKADATLSKEEREIKKHLEEVVGMAENIKTTKNVEQFLASAKKLEKIKPEEALKYLDEALEHFNYEVIDNAVVQISDRNCINVVQKVDEFLETGKISKAMPSKPRDIFELEEMYGKTFLTYKIPSLQNVMKEGERGIIFGNKGINEIGHVFNVVKIKGELKFIDGQIGKAANLKAGYVEFKYFKTK